MTNTDNTVYMGTDENGEDIGNLFSPAQLIIPAGTLVEWKNLDDMTHTATSDSGSTESFDSEVKPNKTFQYTFNKTGTYGYHCKIHGSDGSGMAGTITVHGV